MKHLSFVIWMLFFPALMSITEMLTYRYGRRAEYSDGVRALSALIDLLIWFIVGSALFKAAQ